MKNKLQKTTRVEINCDSNVQIVSVHGQDCIYQHGKTVSMDNVPIGITRCIVSEMIGQEKKIHSFRRELEENTVDKSTLWMVFWITLLSIAAAICLSFAYEAQGWENYYTAGFLTIGIIVPILILSTVKVSDWMTARRSARTHNGS